MRIVRGRNVNDLYRAGRALLEEEGITEKTRAGLVMVLPYPVMSIYDRPQERVLYCPTRDGNPFFHLFESLWMLAGRQDATWLDRFVGDFSKRFAEADGHMHGAYGYRWRRHFQRGQIRGGELCLDSVDQLTEVIKLLRKNKGDRQCVIQMWDAEVDLGVPDLKDRPCNTQLYLRVREDLDRGYDVLDMTILCRSNDVIWGAYGANAVHMSVLMEYLAAGIGVRMGKMYQFSHNFHGYVDILGKKALPEAAYDPYYMGEALPMDMITDFENFDNDVEWFVKQPANLDHQYYNPWFSEVAIPMYAVHQAYRATDRDTAIACCERIKAVDWRLAAEQWLRRRRY